MAYLTSSQKLQGDPGIFGTLGKIVGGAAGLIGKLPGPAGFVGGTIAGLVGGKKRGGRLPTTPPFVLPGGKKVGPLVIEPGAALPGGRPLVSRLPTQRKRRRMDPLNAKALRRATRRLAAFDREKKKVEKELRKIAPRPQRRARRDLGPHHTHVR